MRKASKQEVADARSRIQKASAQVDDDMRLINRLIAALSHITGCRSISSIRQTCTTLSKYMFFKFTFSSFSLDWFHVTVVLFFVSYSLP